MNSLIHGKRFQQWVLSLLIPAFAFLGSPLEANPTGGQVVHGAANFQQITASHLRIEQLTSTAIINWDSFSIGAGELTQFAQPSQNASVLNRVTSGNITQIHGQLQGNGNVYVINPNGIVIGATGVIDVTGSAVLSTLDITNDDFLDGGPNRYFGDSTTGVTNFGTVSSSDGDVILLGGFVDNQGQIGALNGTVALGSGGDILVQESSAGKISIQGGSDYTGNGINNDGTIQGASAELKAHGNVYALAINSGSASTIRATSASRSGGRVRLVSSGGSSAINLGGSVVARSGNDGGTVEVDAGVGNVNVTASVDASGVGNGGRVSIAGRNTTQSVGSTIDVSGGVNGGSALVDATKVNRVHGEVRADGAAGAGGAVDVTAANVVVHETARISADGNTAGGKVRIGGEFQGRDVAGLREADRASVGEGAVISADAENGDAGTAIVWANGDTMFFGEIYARAKGAVGNGGLIEVSGKHHLLYDGIASATSVGGKAGTILFDPGDVTIGNVAGAAPPLGSPIFDSTISIQAINETLQAGTSVIVATESGTITFANTGQGGFDLDGNALNDRHAAIQWTNSLASFGAFASENIVIENHIRTSGGGSINLIAGWSGSELDEFGNPDAPLTFDPQSAWDFYLGTGQFGEGGGSIFVGNRNMSRHVIVGSRFGDTNLAGFNIQVQGSDQDGGAGAYNGFAQVGFHDMGNLFAPRLNNGGGIVLDLTTSTNAWYLSDGLNNSNPANDQPMNGVGSPIVGVVGLYEVDINGDGIVDGVRGIGSSDADIYDGNNDGILQDTFIPYANHFDSAGNGNWWWQQIEQGGVTDAGGVFRAGSTETKDPLGLGGLRPENGAGSATNGADINVIARGNVQVQGGSGREHGNAMIGHGGSARASWGGGNGATRETGNEDRNNAAFGLAGVERNQLERRWSINGSTSDRISHSIARLAPVYGDINVYAGVVAQQGVSVNRNTGQVTATVGTGGTVVVRGAQAFETVNESFNSPAQIGHGGIGQFGEYFGDINVEAGGNIILEAGSATRSHATIGHTFNGHAYWNPTSVVDQQIRFFATVGDFDNPNLRRGELFSGNITTGLDPGADPAASDRYNLTNYPLDGFDANGREINLALGYNPAWYTRGDDNRGTNNQGVNTLAPLDLAPNGPITVDALDGSTISGLHGDVTVVSRSGRIDVKAYSTPEDARSPNPNGPETNDRRFAGIGHGGSNFAFWTEGSGYIGIDGIPNDQTDGSGNPDAREIVVWEAGTDTAGTNSDTASGSRTQVGNVGSDRPRAVQFMTITGDVDVSAAGDISVVAGNDIYDYARIGHGGVELADSETSSFILGDIRVNAGGDLLVQGGGAIPNNVRVRGARNFDMHAWSIIGHGGFRNGFFGFTGDIQVDVGGDITVRGGAHSDSGAKIGHQTVESWGQVGGDFIREENFRRDMASTDVSTSLTNAGATVDYEVLLGPDLQSDGAKTMLNRTFNTAGTLLGDRNTADIEVRAGGSVTLDHLALGNRLSDGQAEYEAATSETFFVNPDDQGQGVRTRRGFSMIGHGGRATDSFREDNINTNFGDKIGDITVVAETGSVIMENGTGEQRWTRIGHGLDRSDRTASTATDYSRAIELAGNITVTAGQSISVNALAADENEQSDNTNAQNNNAAPSRWNPVVIGHGGIWDNLDLVVLGNGEDVNGIVASSDITVNAGLDLSVLGGRGWEGSSAQIGHGFASDQGNDAARRLGAHTGFTGDISVNVLRNLLVEGGPNAWSLTPSTINDSGVSVFGAFAAIGHGGYQLDAPSFGDITVYVGGNAEINGQQVTDSDATTSVDNAASDYPIVNPDTLVLGSAFNFAKVGHFSVENPSRQAGFGDLVTNANQTGDIVVVVNGNLAVQGGTTPNVDTQTIYGAFGQIGHGGPGIAGDLQGDVTVLVRGSLDVIGGSDREDGTLSTRAMNNYAMIGNGTRVYDPQNSPDPDTPFRADAIGFRDGNIVVAVGGSGNFEDALIGHGDRAVSTQTTTGNTQIAVSRNFPFFGGGGSLTATENTTFTSGGYGSNGQLELYMPSRSTNFMDDTTRLNEASIGYVEEPGDFVGLNGTGELAGRDDEVYLTPDLWWDQAGFAASAGFSGGGVFPTDASGSQGGAIANVAAPGGIPNLQSLVSGALGSSASVYRDANGVSGGGFYTIYYDATEFVSTSFPVPPVPVIPPIVFDFSGRLFPNQFESFFLFQQLLRDGYYDSEGNLIFGLGLFETDEEQTEESGAWKIENRLDNAFGKRRDSFSEEELAEEEEKRRRRGGNGVGSIGLTYYVFEPGTNLYSSYRLFGTGVTTFYPEN